MMQLRRYSRRPSLGPLFAALLVVGLGSQTCLAFGVSISISAPTTSTSLFLSTTATAVYDGSGSNGDSHNRKDRAAIMARNNARTCVKGLLTQRAIQSFMFLLEECRDPHSGKWIEDFLGLTNLGNYHGTGAFDIDRFPSWHMVLMTLMEMPKDEIIVSAKRRGRGHGGWSKHNPYLEERWVEIPIEIDPVSLAQRILSVRGHIATEFIQDLDIVISTNDQILDSYFENIRYRGVDATASSSSLSGSSSPEEIAATFDRITSIILSRNMENQVVASSPFRKGNFDLLYNLCTQASIHELLREYQDAGESKEVSFTWLRDFYVNRVAKFFDGDQPYGRADDFVEEMLLTPPAVRDLGLSRNGKVIIGLIDPVGVAERIIARRSSIANDWKQSMRETSLDHLQIQKALLAKIMGRSIEDFKREIMEQNNKNKQHHHHPGHETFQ